MDSDIQNSGISIKSAPLLQGSSRGLQVPKLTEESMGLCALLTTSQESFVARKLTSESRKILHGVTLRKG